MADNNPPKEVKGSANLPLTEPLEFEDFIDYMESEKKSSFVVLFVAKKSRPYWWEINDVYNKFETVSMSLKRSVKYKENTLFFSIVEFQNESDVLEKVHLKKAPLIIHYPPSGKPGMADYMDLQEDTKASAIAKWVLDRTKVEIKILPPSLFLEPRRFFMDKFMRLKIAHSNPNVIATLAVLFCYEMTSGVVSANQEPKMFDVKNDGLVLVMKNFSRQYVSECFIIIFLYCAFGVSMISVIQGMRMKSDNKRNITVTGLVMTFISFLLIKGLFRMKIGPYYPL